MWTGTLRTGSSLFSYLGWSFLVTSVTEIVGVTTGFSAIGSNRVFSTFAPKIYLDSISQSEEINIDIEYSNAKSNNLGHYQISLAEIFTGLWI